MKLYMLFAVQNHFVINSDVDFVACESKIQHQSSGRVRIIYQHKKSLSKSAYLRRFREAFDHIYDHYHRLE